MKRHHRLAGAGSTLHEQHPAHRGTDDLVLLPLDRRDDVAESAGARRLDRRDQRTLASDLLAARRVGQSAEHLVVDPEKCPAPGRERRRRSMPIASRPVAR